MITSMTSILAGWLAQRATQEQKRKDAAGGRREDHDDAWEKYRETGNVEDLGPYHVVSSHDPFKGNYSLQGDIANWKAWEAPIPEIAKLGTLQASHRELAEAWKDSYAYNTCCNLFQNHVLRQDHICHVSRLRQPWRGFSPCSDRHSIDYYSHCVLITFGFSL